MNEFWSALIWCAVMPVVAMCLAAVAVWIGRQL